MAKKQQIVYLAIVDGEVIGVFSTKSKAKVWVQSPKDIFSVTVDEAQVDESSEESQDSKDEDSEESEDDSD